VLVERFNHLFLSSEDGPVATGDGGVAVEASIELVLAVRDAINELWKAHTAEIKRTCAPFMPQGLIAKQEVFGFALADALGRPILPGDKAMKVGQYGDNAVRFAEGSKDRPGKLTAAREAARSAVRKARRAADKDKALEQGVADAEKAGEAAIAAVLARRVDLDLPNETVGAKRKARPAASVPAPAAVPPAAPTLNALQSAVAEAQASVDAAQPEYAADRLRLERAQKRVDAEFARRPRPLGYWSRDEFPLDSEGLDEWMSANAKIEAENDEALASWDATLRRHMTAAKTVATEYTATRAAYLAANRALLHAMLALQGYHVAMSEYEAVCEAEASAEVARLLEIREVMRARMRASNSDEH
jgi:hypothetical protein